MTLAPGVQSLIDWGRDVNTALGELPLLTRRGALRDELDRELRRRGVSVEVAADPIDRLIRVDGGEIRVRAFRPRSTGPHPAFVHFHGGGFVFGTIDALVNDAKCAHICAAAECVVVTVDYRLAPEHRFPTAPEDCYAALLWAVRNAAQLDIDPGLLAVGGESAGGNLAAVVALMARDRDGPQLALQVLEVPVTDMSARAVDYPSVALFGDGFGLDYADMEYFTTQYLSAASDAEKPYASPALATDLAGVAPAHIITAEFDVLRDSGEDYARRLLLAGVSTTVDRRPGHTHGSSVLWQEWEPAREWMDEVVSALQRAFHSAKVEPS